MLKRFITWLFWLGADWTKWPCGCFQAIFRNTGPAYYRFCDTHSLEFKKKEAARGK